jgi:Peroxidase, family 2
MANHGYISRTGITSSQELAWAMQESYGLSLDLAQFLGFLSTGVDGNRESSDGCALAHVAHLTDLHRLSLHSHR